MVWADVRVRDFEGKMGKKLLLLLVVVVEVGESGGEVNTEKIVHLKKIWA